MTDVNPYESPKTPTAPPEVTNRSTSSGVTAIFTISTPEPHEVEIYFSRWTGLEVYWIDGLERLRHHNWAFSGVQRFEIAGPTPHVLEIAVKAVPWWRASASLDGRLVVDDLFPSERRLAVRVLMTVFVTLLVLGAMALGALVWSGAAQDMLREWRWP